MSKKGGYVIVDLKGQSITAGTPFTLDGVSARLDRAKNKACLLSGFAIGDEEKRDVFVDLQKTEDGYVALFGQYTITIEDDEVTITNGGVLLESIVDSQGHKRFIEGTSDLETVSGLTIAYNKWSLSGSHLMIVLAGTMASTFSTNQVRLATVRLPNWVREKIIPINLDRVTVKAMTLVNDDYSTFTRNIMLTKSATSVLDACTIQIIAGTSPSANAGFRIEFDLLIDTAE